MALNIWELVVALFREGKETEDEEEKRGVPSPLDLSVRVGHGGKDDEAVRELSNIQRQAQELEESQRGN